MHVAVEKSQLEGIVKCSAGVLPLLVPLLETLGVLIEHPGLMQPHSIDSIGWHIDETLHDECRARLVSGDGLGVVYKIRKFDVLFCEAADKLPSAQRRQCAAIRGTNEVARRLDPSERGAAEIVVSFPSGGTLSVRQNRNAQRMVLLLTSAQGKKKVLDAVLPQSDVPQLERLFGEAAKGQRQAAPGPSTESRLIKLENGAYWCLPAWYAEAVALLAQDVFRRVWPNSSRSTIPLGRPSVLVRRLLLYGDTWTCGPIQVTRARSA